MVRFTNQTDQRNLSSFSKNGKMASFKMKNTNNLEDSLDRDDISLEENSIQEFLNFSFKDISRTTKNHRKL